MKKNIKQIAGSKGGTATAKKYGSKHFAKLAKRSWKIRKENMLSKA